MSENVNVYGPLLDAKAAVCEPVCESRPDSVLPKTHTSDGITTIRRVIVHPGLDAMPSSALHLAHDLLSRQVKGEVLTERELGQLDILRSAMHGEPVLPADSTPVAPGAERDRTFPAESGLRRKEHTWN